MPQATDTQALIYVPEVTWGVSPTTGWKTARYSGESLAGTQERVTPPELLAVRENTASVRVASGSAGDVNASMHYGTFDDWLEGLFGSTWATNVLKVGNTKKSFSIEKQLSSLTTPKYNVFPGCYVGGMNLQARGRQPMSVTFSFVGLTPTWADTTASSGGSPSAANTNPNWNGVDHVSGITEGGGAQAGVQGITLTVDNGLRSLDQLGDIDPYAIQMGKFALRGTLDVYLESETLIEKFLQDTESSLALTIGPASALKYALSIAKLKYTAGRAVAGGAGSDVLAAMEFEAYLDATDTTFKWTRTP